MYNCVTEMDVDRNGNITYLHIRSEEYGEQWYYDASEIPFEISCTQVPCSSSGSSWTETPDSNVTFPEYTNYYNDIKNGQ